MNILKSVDEHKIQVGEHFEENKRQMGLYVERVTEGQS